MALTDAQIAAKYANVPAGAPPSTDAQIAAKYGVAPGEDRTISEAPGFLDKFMGAVHAQQKAPEPVPPPANTFMQRVSNAWNYPDPSAKAMMKTMGYLPGLLGDAGMEALKRVATKKHEGLGEDEWIQALLGNAKSVPTHLQEMGLGKAASYAAGLPLAAKLDPTSNFFGGRIGAVDNVVPQTSAVDSLLETRPGGAPSPISQGLQSAGEKVYKGWLGPAEAKLMDKRGLTNEGAYGDYLWNNGQPKVGGFGKSNAAIEDQIKALKPEAWKQMEGPLSSATAPYDLAPVVTKGRGVAGEAELARRIEEQLEKAANQAKRDHANALDYNLRNPTPEQAAELHAQGEAAKDELRPKFQARAADPNDTEFNRIRAKGQDAFDSNFKTKMKEALAGEQNRRNEGATVLKQLAPDFAGLIDENLAKIKAGHTQDAQAFFGELVDAVAEGPRSLTELQKLGSGYGQSAAGNEAMKSSAYQVGGKITPSKVNDMGAQKVLSDLVEREMAKQLGADHPLVGQYIQGKKNYGIVAGGEEPAIDVARGAAKTPPMTKVEMTLGAGALMHPEEFGLPFAASIGHRMLTKTPRAATGAGMLLNNLGQSGIWDTMLRNLKL